MRAMTNFDTIMVKLAKVIEEGPIVRILADMGIASEVCKVNLSAHNVHNVCQSTGLLFLCRPGGLLEWENVWKS